jgi:hypothetical protein
MPTVASRWRFTSRLWGMKNGWLRIWPFGVYLKGFSLSTLRHPRRLHESSYHCHKQFIL